VLLLASSVDSDGCAYEACVSFLMGLKQKAYYRKLITKKQKVMSQMKGQDKIPEKQLNEVEIGNFPEK